MIVGRCRGGSSWLLAIRIKHAETNGSSKNLPWSSLASRIARAGIPRDWTSQVSAFRVDRTSLGSDAFLSSPRGFAPRPPVGLEVKNRLCCPSPSATNLRDPCATTIVSRPSPPIYVQDWTFCRPRLRASMRCQYQCGSESLQPRAPVPGCAFAKKAQLAGWVRPRAEPSVRHRLKPHLPSTRTFGAVVLRRLLRSGSSSEIVRR